MAVSNTLSPTRAENYPEWYQQVIKAADMAEASSVRGCMIIKPWGYGIWQRLQQGLDTRFRETGHENCYFPLFIPLRLIEKEAEHAAGFAKEMAVVTHHRLVMGPDGHLKPDGELEEPLVVRPTSETIIGEAMANWIHSYRDLPMLLNQWANVVRWEMRTRLFLRTAEFLWQEGHTAHATREDAVAETMQMLEIYREISEEHVALPVIMGEKPAHERFAGAVDTYCIEAMMQDGRALQAGTSHYLGQNFARAAGIQYQTKEGGLEYVHTTSWGVSTRMIGGLIMAHADDIGLRVPPRLAPHQIVLVPITRSEEDEAAVAAFCQELSQRLSAEKAWGEPVRVHWDRRDRASVDKRWEWVRKGAPLVCEIGPRDVQNRAVTFLRRDQFEAGKQTAPIDAFLGQAVELLRQIQQGMFDAAAAMLAARTRTDITTYDQFREVFAGEDRTDGVFVRAPWCEDPASLPLIEEMNVTIRCLPLDGQDQGGVCVLTGKPAKRTAIFAKAY